MLNTLTHTDLRAKTFSDCSGCSLCLLVCPVWRRTRDVSLTPHGRAKAMQNGAVPAEMAAAIDSCTLCMACEPVCPEDIGLVEMILSLRRAGADARVDLPPLAPATLPRAMPSATQTSLLLPDAALAADGVQLARVATLLGASAMVAADNGADIALLLASGRAVTDARRDTLLAQARQFKKIIVGDGLLLRQLRRWLPNANLQGLGEALSARPAVREALCASDLYVIDARAYHTDYQRLVKYYDHLRADVGCAMNLDLQRIAIPATARNLAQRLGVEAPVDDAEQGRWLLQGRKVSRVVAESLEDAQALAKITDLPVVYLAALARGDASAVANDLPNEAG